MGMGTVAGFCSIEAKARMAETPCIEALDSDSLVGGNITSVLTALVTRARLIGRSFPTPAMGKGSCGDRGLGIERLVGGRALGSGEWGLGKVWRAAPSHAVGDQVRHA